MPKARDFKSQAPCLTADCPPGGGQLAAVRDHPGQRHLIRQRAKPWGHPEPGDDAYPAARHAASSVNHNCEE
jgi:hypothetical protein